ncbi:MAG TPA: hypothetical protein EYH19_02485, partial [Desulfocapsa sulfexigens]|nr:hypothetical protein [Desulfocapsa sulfexigens]
MLDWIMPEAQYLSRVRLFHRLIASVETFSKSTFDDSVNIEITGIMAGVNALNDRMGDGVKS